jgi:hypothetical protein
VPAGQALAQCLVGVADLNDGLFAGSC